MSSALTYRPEIDGLRALAVLAVILFHAEFSIYGIKIFSGGYLGVDVFFVISGYLISSIILKGLTSGQFRFANFYDRRVRRIVPLLYVVILTSIPFAYHLLLPEAMIDFSKSVLGSTFFTSNFVFWMGDGYWDAPSHLKPLLHTWSLGVEEQFYILMPFILIGLWRLKHHHAFILVLTGLSLLSFAFAAVMVEKFPDFSFYLLPTRFWELCAGAILAVWVQHSYKSTFKLPSFMQALMKTIGLLCILIPMLFFDEKTPHPSWGTLFPIFGTVCLIAFMRGQDWVTRCMTLKPVVGIGLVSYGFYLWHYPIFVFARLSDQMSLPLHKIGWVLCALFLSIITYFCVEQPFRNPKKVSFKKLVAILGSGTMLIIGVSIFAMQDGLSSRFPQFIVPPVKEKKIENHVWFTPNVQGKSDKNIILVGDSHMQVLAPEIRKRFLGEGYRYAQSVFTACQLILNLNRIDLDTGQAPKCYTELNENRMLFIEDAPPSLIIVGGRLPMILEESGFDNTEGGIEHGFNSEMQYADHTLKTKVDRQSATLKEYKATIERFLNVGHQVLFIYPIPEVGVHVPKTLLKRIDGKYNVARDVISANPITTSYDVFKKRTQSAYALLDSIEHPNIIRVYPEHIFCDSEIKDRCMTHDHNDVFYRDDDHLSQAGAKKLTDKIVDLVR